LGLDRGYLSRILKGFGAKGLLARAASVEDARRQHLRLTAAGRRVFAPLERRSQQQVRSMLSGLDGSRRQALLEAMSVIRLAFGAAGRQAQVSLRTHRPGDMGWVIERHGALYFREYGWNEEFEALVAAITAEFIRKLDPARERCWIAERDGENVGSVFLVKKSQTVAKLRLLLVEPSARGLGIGKHLVSECVRFARRVRYKKILLWTQSELAAARDIYQNAGFKLVGAKKHDSWSRKGLVAETWELKL
jgi:GNAT superfamily N-acetyltransferase